MKPVLLGCHNAVQKLKILHQLRQPALKFRRKLFAVQRLKQAGIAVGDGGFGKKIVHFHKPVNIQRMPFLLGNASQISV